MREYQRRSGRVPSPLRNYEELLDCNLPYWSAYLDLAQRSSLSYAEINAYAEITGLSKTELMVKVHTIEESLHDNHS